MKIYYEDVIQAIESQFHLRINGKFESRMTLVRRSICILNLEVSSENIVRMKKELPGIKEVLSKLKLSREEWIQLHSLDGTSVQYTAYFGDTGGEFLGALEHNSIS